MWGLSPARVLDLKLSGPMGWLNKLWRHLQVLGCFGELWRFSSQPQEAHTSTRT